MLRHISHGRRCGDSGLGTSGLSYLQSKGTEQARMQ